MSPRPLLALFALSALAACSADGGDVELLPLAPARVTVGETLRMRVDVDNPAGRALTFRVLPVWEGTLSGFETVHAIAGSPTGAEFRWTPLVSHIGEQELRFEVDADGALADTGTVVISVLPAGDAAPSFVRPGSGGAFDLTRTPCVELALEVRDGDSATVAIRARSALPEGSTLTEVGPKSADFRWCPTPAQIGASQRWVLEFEAEDESHPPVLHDYVAVLRTPTSEDCPGALPEVGVTSPADGATTDSPEIVATATDAEGLRDAPLLYWTTETPDDLDAPDVTRFEQVTLRPMDGAFVGDIGLTLEADEERLVYYLISAVDNDDAGGSLCDHRVDGPLRTMTLVGGGAGLERAPCEPCGGGPDCASGVCAPGAGGSVCLPLCDACETGTCGMVATVEGPLTMACGDVAAVCAPPPVCAEDAFEPDGTRAEATVRALGRVTGLELCDPLGDHHRYDAQFADLVTFRVDNFTHAEGNLDLRVLDASGAIVDLSENLGDEEAASHCARGDEPVYAHVVGFEGATGTYDLVIERVADGCCVDDASEPDDAVPTARPDGSPIGGVLCPGDDDVYALIADRPSRVTLTLEHERGDLDVELLAPDGVTVIARADTGTLSETLIADVTGGGRYTFRVYGSDEASPYTGSLSVEEIATCAETRECAAGDVCDVGTCRDGACTSGDECPSDHACALGRCAPACAINADCRSSEACKRSFSGRICGARGPGANGAACVDFTDCGGQRECVAPSLGGFCARVGCTTNAECETGTYCVGDATLSICSVACSPGECRPGFACTLVPTLEGPAEAVCWPE